MNITIRLMTTDDYSQVHQVDILTQKQYLGTKFDQMSEEEQDSHLVSRKAEFQINEVNSKTQGKGIGLLLYQKLIKKAKQTGIKKIWSLINIDNSQSIKLHEKIGFKLNDRKEAILDVNKC